jgi:hypothetical protein
MKTLFAFFRAWLLLCFVLAFLVVPFYLVAIYPEVPTPYYRVFRSIGYGVGAAQPSLAGFFVRLGGCGLVVAFGLLIVFKWLREPAERRPGKSRAHAR